MQTLKNTHDELVVTKKNELKTKIDSQLDGNDYYHLKILEKLLEIEYAATWSIIKRQIEAEKENAVSWLLKDIKKMGMNVRNRNSDDFKEALPILYKLETESGFKNFETQLKDIHVRHFIFATFQ